GEIALVGTLSGLVRPRLGSVRVDGRELTREAREEIARLGVAHVPEGRGVIGQLTVDENLELGGLWRRDRRDHQRAVAEAYELFPALADRRSLLASNLSGGERQMLSLGRALAARPRVLLMDEPSLGLAPRVLSQLMVEVKALSRDRGLSVLLIEQNARSALSVADEGLVLSLGQVVARDTTDRLLEEEGLRRAYLGF